MLLIFLFFPFLLFQGGGGVRKTEGAAIEEAQFQYMRSKVRPQILRSSQSFEFSGPVGKSPKKHHLE